MPYALGDIGWGHGPGINGKFLVRGRCFRTLPSPHELTVFPGCSIAQGPLGSPGGRGGPAALRPALNDSTFHLKHFQSKSFQDWMWKRHATTTPLRPAAVQQCGARADGWGCCAGAC